LRRRISALALLACALVPSLAPAATGASATTRAGLRAAGGDRATALRVAEALFARPLDLQLLRVRCERVAARSFCGLTLSGVKFHHRVDTARFEADVDALVRGALAVDPRIAEVDLWVTVPADAGKGAVVSGDFAVPATATVYAATTPRAQSARPSVGANVFWDPAFRRELDAGSNG
jgi:hypothetical protein